MVDRLGGGGSHRLCPGARVPWSSGCVDSIQQRFKEFLWGAVSKFPSWTSVEFVGSSEDMLCLSVGLTLGKITTKPVSLTKLDGSWHKHFVSLTRLPEPVHSWTIFVDVIWTSKLSSWVWRPQAPTGYRHTAFCSIRVSR